MRSGENVMCTPVRPVTISPLWMLATNFRPSRHEKNSVSSRTTIHLPKWQPSNGQAFSSITGSGGSDCDEPVLDCQTANATANKLMEKKVLDTFTDSV